MNQPFVLKVILLDNTAQRLTLPNGLPDTVEELTGEVINQCGLTSNIRLQFMDPLFGNEYLNLTNTNELQNRGTIRVINMSEESDSVTLVLSEVLSPTSLPLTESSSLASLPLSESSSQLSVPISEAATSARADETCLSSSFTEDTDILSSPQSDPGFGKLSWPPTFIVPVFSYDSEMKLEKGNAMYKKNGTLLLPDLKLRSNVLEMLIQEIVRYKVYVTDKQFNSVCAALIAKHPCLTQRGSDSGYAGWKKSLKDKLAHYRTELRKLGCPEVVVNAMAKKPQGKSPAFGIKKPKRSEVNYCPPFPVGETEATLEKVRVELLTDVKLRNGKETVKAKMEKTFSYRRYEVIREAPMVQDFKGRWPALFDVFEINAEFKRLTTLPLQSRFLSKLDLLSCKLQTLYEKRAGQIKKKLKQLMEAMITDDVDSVRECILRALCVYLNEDPENLIKDHVGQDIAAFDNYAEDTTVGIFTSRHHEAQSKPDDIGIILEGQIVIQQLDNVPLAISLLFGLLYALNMDYPPQLRYFFEVVQKVIMELDGGVLSKKAQVLKNRLHE